MGELHLEIIVDRLRREFKVECEVGAPQVNYREGISKGNEVRYVHKKQSGGSGQFADVAIRFEPGEPGTGFVFKSEIKGGSVPKEYVPGVVKGLEECMSSGSLAGECGAAWRGFAWAPLGVFSPEGLRAGGAGMHGWRVVLGGRTHVGALDAVPPIHSRA